MPVFANTQDESDTWQGAQQIGFPTTGFMQGLSDTDWFKLNVSPGTYEISVLPDLTRILYPDFIADQLGKPRGIPELDQETDITASIWEQEIVNGVAEVGEVGSLTQKRDDLAMQMSGQTTPAQINFYDGTFTFTGQSTVGNITETGEYYLKVEGQAVPLLLGTSGDPADLSHFTNDAGRYLITTGNPTGQRSSTWGPWIETYNYTDGTQPQSPITLPGDVPPTPGPIDPTTQPSYNEYQSKADALLQLGVDGVVDLARARGLAGTAGFIQQALAAYSDNSELKAIAAEQSTTEAFTDATNDAGDVLGAALPVISAANTIITDVNENGHAGIQTNQALANADAALLGHLTGMMVVEGATYAVEGLGVLLTSPVELPALAGFAIGYLVSNEVKSLTVTALNGEFPNLNLNQMSLGPQSLAASAQSASIGGITVGAAPPTPAWIYNADTGTFQWKTPPDAATLSFCIMRPMTTAV